MQEPGTSAEAELNDALFALGELYLRYRRTHRKLSQTEHILKLTQDELAAKNMEEATRDDRF